MVMTVPFGQRVVFVKRVKDALPDAYGNDTWTTVETTVRGVYNPGGSSEIVQGQDLVTMQPSVYLPSGTDVASIDAVKVAGEVFEVDGSPNVWLSPFSSWSPGVEVKLRRVTG